MTLEAYTQPVSLLAAAVEFQPEPEVARPREAAHLRRLSSSEIQRLSDLQDYLLTDLRRHSRGDSEHAERLRQLENLVLDEARGIVRNERGEITARIGRPYYGEATREALRLWIESLERHRIPGLYTAIANARSQMPTRGPIPLEVDDGGRAISTGLFLERARNGQLRCNLGINLQGDAIPSWDDVTRLSRALDFVDRAEAINRRVALTRQQEIVRRRIERMGMPRDWPTETAEQCQAAMTVMSLASETSRIVSCINHLSSRVTPQRRAELMSLIEPGNLPPGVRVEREGGRPDGRLTVRFEFPRHTDLQDPSFRPQLRAMFEYCDRNARIVDQMMAAERRINDPRFGDARNTIAWLDMPTPNGWVRMTRGGNGEISHEFSMGQRPEGQGWVRTNLIEFRCNVTEDRDTNTGVLRSVRVQNTMDYLDIPWFSYLDLYRPRAEGCQQLHRPDDGPRNPDDWACVRVSPSEMRFMRYRDLADHADEQAFWYWAGKTTVAVMDASMLIGGVSSVAAGVRAVRAARTVAGVTQAVERATARGAIHNGAELMTRLATDTARRAAQQELAAAGRRSLYHGFRDIFLALSSLPSTNAATHETPGLREFAMARSAYMLLSIGRHLAIDGPRSLIRTALGREASLAQRLMDASLQSGPSWIRSTGTAGHWGAGLSQIPFSMEQWRILRQMNDADDPMVNAIRDAQDRRGEAHEFHSDPLRRALRDRLPGAGGASSLEEIGRTLERFRASLGVNDQARSDQIRAIIDGTRQLIADAPWLAPDFVGPPERRLVEAWEERRNRFINEHIAPLFFGSGQQIRTAEMRRAETIGLPELRRQRGFSDQQIHSMEQAQQFGPRDREVRAAAAIALLYLCRNGSGGLTGTNVSGTDRPDEGVLLQRQEEVPGWRVERERPNTQTGSETNNNRREVFEVRTRPVTQQLRLSELTALLEADLQPDRSTVRRIETGAILTRFGMPGEAYAGVLRNIVRNADTPPAERNRAILYLGSIMQGLRAAEAGRSSLDQNERDEIAGINNGLNSRKIQAFLIEFARDPNNDRDSRAMARYVAMFRDRNHISEQELTRFRTILERNPPTLTFAEFAQDMRTAALQTNPQTLADWERKFQAARVLSDFLDVPQADLGCTASQLNRAIAACVNAPAAFEERAAAQRLLLQTARNERRGQAEIERLSQELNRINLQRIHAGDIALAATQELLTPVRQNGTLRRLIDHMDASDDPVVRNAAMQARRGLLDLLKKNCESREDVRIRVQIMNNLEPLLSDARLVRGDAVGQETRTQLAAMRREMGFVLRALLTPGLTNQQQLNEVNRQYPGLINTEAVLPYLPLYRAAQNTTPALRDLAPPLRESAIYALTALNDRASAPLIRRLVFTENEPNADVRLAGVRALKRLLPQEEMRALVQEILARTTNDPAHPPELDPGVAVELEQRFVPVGLGVAPDGAVFRRAHNDAMAILANRDRDDRAIIANVQTNFSWLLANNVRAEVAQAMATRYSNRFSYFWEDWNAVPGAPTSRAAANELAAGNEVLRNLRTRFGRLCTTASEGSAADARNAREALYWILTTDPTQWSRTRLDAQLNTGFAGNRLPVNAETFRGLQTMACEALVECVTRRGPNGQLIRLPDEQSRAVEELLLRAITHPNTTTVCRIQLLQAIQALSEPAAAGQNRERAAEIPLRFCAGIADRLLLTLQRPTTGTERERDQEMQLRERFARHAMYYIARHSEDPLRFARLQAVADTQHISSYTRQYALDLIANHRDRVLPVLRAVLPDQVNGNNPEARLSLLQSARSLAEPYQIVLGAEVQNNAQTRELTQDLNTLRARSAVELIFQATHGLPIENATDQRGQLLLGLLNPRYHERIRLAAAIALVNESRVSAHREEAIRLLAERFVRSQTVTDRGVVSELEGSRRDAFEILRGLPDSDRGRVSEAFYQLSNRLLTGMRTFLGQNGVQNAASLSEEETVRRLQQLDSNPAKQLLMQYARCQTMIGVTMAPDSDETARRHLTTAVNIYRGRDCDAALISADAENSLHARDFWRYRGSPQAREVAFALEQLSDLYSQQLHSSREARLLYGAARGIIYYSLGSNSNERVQSDLRGMRILRNEMADLRTGVDDARRTFQELEAALAQARRTPNANNIATLEQEVTAARTAYRQQLEQYDTRLRRAVETFAETRSDSILANLIRARGRESREVAQFCDMRADVLLMLAGVKLGLANLEQNQTNRQPLQELANTNARQAIQVLRTALNIRLAAHAPAEEILNSRQRLANVYFQGGQLQNARAQFEAMQTLIGSANTARAAEVQRQLAIVQFRLENQEGGDACFARWLSITRALHGERSPEVAQVLETQARTLMQQRRFDRAETLLREAVLCESDGPLRDSLADRYFMLADTCYGQPARRQQAIAALESCLEIRRERDPGGDVSLRNLWSATRVFAALGAHNRVQQAVQAHANALADAGVPRANITALLNSYAQFLEEEGDRPANQASRTAIRALATQLRNWTPAPAPNNQ
jgi:hypothetical protein